VIVLGCRSTKEEDTDGGVVEDTERKGMISRSETGVCGFDVVQPVCLIMTSRV